MTWPEQVNQVVCADALEYLQQIPDGVVQTCITSPPYWGLRDYGTAEWEGGDPKCDHVEQKIRIRNNLAAAANSCDGGSRSQTNRQDNDSISLLYRKACGKCGAIRIDKQLGLEATPEEYVAKMVEVFWEVRRVLRDDGTCWLNLGDTYCNNSQSGGGDPTISKRNLGGAQQPCVAKASYRRDRRPDIDSGHKAVPGLKPKDLCMMPARVALALQADGWWLRSDIIWSKPNPMPESVTDRPTKAHEYLFLLSRSEKYFYDADAIREDGPSYTRKAGGYYGRDGNNASRFGGKGGFGDSDITTYGRNKRTVWTIATEPCPEAHFATIPKKLVEPCILAGTSEKGQCPECGKPWVRVVEIVDVDGRLGSSYHDHSDDLKRGQRDVPAGEGSPVKKTRGWRPDCLCGEICPADPVPQIVLDPFCGKGTVAEVAIGFDRDYLTCDLNREYCEMARGKIGKVPRGYRIAQQELFNAEAG